MSDNVVVLGGTTTLDIPVERVVKGAMDANLAEVVIVGFDQDGELYVASNTAQTGRVWFLLDRAKSFLIRQSEL